MKSSVYHWKLLGRDNVKHQLKEEGLFYKMGALYAHRKFLLIGMELEDDMFIFGFWH